MISVDSFFDLYTESFDLLIFFVAAFSLIWAIKTSWMFTIRFVIDENSIIIKTPLKNKSILFSEPLKIRVEQLPFKMTSVVIEAHKRKIVLSSFLLDYMDSVEELCKSLDINGYPMEQIERIRLQAKSKK